MARGWATKEENRAGAWAAMLPCANERGAATGGRGERASAASHRLIPVPRPRPQPALPSDHSLSASPTRPGLVLVAYPSPSPALPPPSCARCSSPAQFPRLPNMSRASSSRQPQPQPSRAPGANGTKPADNVARTKILLLGMRRSVPTAARPTASQSADPPPPLSQERQDIHPGGPLRKLRPPRNPLPRDHHPDHQALLRVRLSCTRPSCVRLPDLRHSSCSLLVPSYPSRYGIALGTSPSRHSPP